MKNFRYLLCAAILFLCACSSSSGVDEIDPVIRTEREALLASSQYGLHHNGTAVLTFDRAQHQLAINPTKHIYRILDNAGIHYVELQLDATPSANAAVGASESNNMNLKLPALGQMILLQSDDERLWLWSDAAHVGFIVPKSGI